MDKQNRTIKIYISEAEKNIIINRASEQQLSVSEYAKKLLVKGPVIQNIIINDLLDFTTEIYQTNCKIQELLSILNQSDKTIDAFYASSVIKNLLSDINNTCNAALKINYEERKKVYHELEYQINNNIL